MLAAKITADAPFQALEPFTPYEHADVIIRSGDGHDFHAVKALLSLCSPVFQDMFSLPQPPENFGDDAEHSLPIVEIPESGTVTDVLLRCMLPVDPPMLFDDHLLSDSYSAARKYEISRAIDACKRAIRDLCSGNGKDVLRAFVLSTTHQLEDETRLAAFKCLRLRLHKPSSLETLDTLSRSALACLIVYHNLVEKRIIDMFDAPQLEWEIATALDCSTCCRASRHVFGVPAWWRERACLIMTNIIYKEGPLSAAPFLLQMLGDPFPFGCATCNPFLKGIGFAGFSKIIEDNVMKVASKVQFRLPWEV